MMQIILLYLYEPILSKWCKSYCCICMSLSCQNDANHTAVSVWTCPAKMLQIILLYLYEPVLPKCCKSYCCTCYNLSCQNVANHTAAPVRTRPVKMLQTRPLYLYESVLSIYADNTAPSERNCSQGQSPFGVQLLHHPPNYAICRAPTYHRSPNWITIPF
jgi:hypothetical protein